MVVKKDCMYRIKDRNTGLYSLGGDAMNLSWDKIGKVWTTWGALKRHLVQMPHIPPSWEIVEVALQDGVVVPTPEVKPNHFFIDTGDGRFKAQLSEKVHDVLAFEAGASIDISWSEKRRHYLDMFYPDWRERYPEWDVIAKAWHIEKGYRVPRELENV